MEDGVLDQAAEDEEDDDFDAIVNKNYLEYQKAQRKKKAAILKQAKMAAAHGTKSVYQGEGSKYQEAKLAGLNYSLQRAATANPATVSSA